MYEKIIKNMEVRKEERKNMEKGENKERIQIKRNN
jgi:hypothetical protein